MQIHTHTFMHKSTQHSQTQDSKNQLTTSLLSPSIANKKSHISRNWLGEACAPSWPQAQVLLSARSPFWVECTCARHASLQCTEWQQPISHCSLSPAHGCHQSWHGYGEWKCYLVDQSQGEAKRLTGCCSPDRARLWSSSPNSHIFKSPSFFMCHYEANKLISRDHDQGRMRT